MEIQSAFYSLFFFSIAFVLIISALGVVFLPKIVYSAVSMILAFLAVAGIFVLLNADFVAVSQIIIYAVGITIVMIFAIMLTGTREDKSLWVAFRFRTLAAFGAAGLLFLAIIFSATGGFKALSQNSGLFAVTQPSAQVIETLQTTGTTGIIGKSLLTGYVLPFEILSLLLLAVILGAVVLAGKGKDLLVNPTTQTTEENS